MRSAYKTESLTSRPQHWTQRLKIFSCWLQNLWRRKICCWQSKTEKLVENMSSDNAQKPVLIFFVVFCVFRSRVRLWTHSTFFVWFANRRALNVFRRMHLHIVHACSVLALCCQNQLNLFAFSFFFFHTHSSHPPYSWLGNSVVLDVQLNWITHKHRLIVGSFCNISW